MSDARPVAFGRRGTAGENGLASTLKRALVSVWSMPREPAGLVLWTMTFARRGLVMCFVIQNVMSCPFRSASSMSWSSDRMSNRSFASAFTASA
jgi:hypothetical protein